MTFGYVGYVWAILGCGAFALFFGGLGVALYAIGKRAERRGPRPVVQSLSGRDAPSSASNAPR